MQKQINTNYQKNIGSATLFALAILILLVSCPLKRLLTNNFSSQTSLLSHPKSTNSTKYFSVSYGENTTCEAGVNSAKPLQASKMQPRNEGTSVFASNIPGHPRHYIHTFLDGSKAVYGLAPASDDSSLPLFLQHRSLLI